MKNHLVWLALCFYSALFGQYQLQKWGEVSPEDLQMTVYPLDSSASSVILQEAGEIRVVPNGNKYQVRHNRYHRIKVFDIKAFDEGNLRILFRSKKSDEKLKDLDVQVIHPDGTREKIKSDNIFTEKITKYWSAKKIFIPGLRKGSIIEYRYELISEDLFSLYDWYFQHETPVRWSELELVIPGVFDYVYLMHTPKPFDVKTSEDAGPGLTRSRFGIGNLPGLKEEPFVTTIDDYRAHIGFQLRSFNSGLSQTEFFKDWEHTAEKMLSRPDFGDQFLKNAKYKSIWNAFEPQITDKRLEEIPEIALRFICAQMKWDEQYRVFSDEGLEAAFEKKSGSSAELNLALVALLRRSGLEASPVLVSTRDNGQVFVQYPFMEQFNSVVASVKMGDKHILLDATQPFHALNQIRREHCNGEGWVVRHKNPEWITISPPENSVAWLGKMKIDEAGSMRGSFSMTISGGMASAWREDLDGADELDFMRRHVAETHEDITFDSIVFKQVADLSKPLAIDFNCQLSSAASAVNDFIYVQPIIDYFITKNPFKSLKRDFPVSFSQPVRANYVLTLALPEGYVIEELPQPARISLADNGGKITYSCSKVSDREVQIILKMNLSQLEFHPEEYDALRKFFDLMEEKIQLQLVLKKKS